MRHTIQTMSLILLAGAMLGGCNYKLDLFGPPELAAGKDIENEEAVYLEDMLDNRPKVTDTNDAVAIGAKANASYHAALKERDKLQTELRVVLKSRDDSQKEAGELKSKLARAEKELAEANTMLLEMREELMKWKKDVLSFRSEMRQSQKALLDGVTRLHVLISGGVAMDPPKTQAAPPIAANIKE